MHGTRRIEEMLQLEFDNLRERYETEVEVYEDGREAEGRRSPG